VKSLDKEQIKEIIKEMLEDGSIEIVPRYINLQVEVAVKIDDEVVQLRYG